MSFHGLVIETPSEEEIISAEAALRLGVMQTSSFNIKLPGDLMFQVGLAEGNAYWQMRVLGEHSKVKPLRADVLRWLEDALGIVSEGWVGGGLLAAARSHQRTPLWARITARDAAKLYALKARPVSRRGKR